MSTSKWLITGNESYAKLGYVTPVVFQVQHYKTKTA